MRGRPSLHVLAGVNGAGKSSVGGFMLNAAGMSWFDPDQYARRLREVLGLPVVEANAEAWQEGMRRLDQAIALGRALAFETTLGGQTVARRIQEAAATHEIQLWYCGLASVEHHLERVRARVAAGGHDIPEERIRERYLRAPANLIGLLPSLAALRVYDNTQPADAQGQIPEPRLLLYFNKGRIQYPIQAAELTETPDWAKPIVEAALQHCDRRA